MRRALLSLCACVALVRTAQALDVPYLLDASTTTRVSSTPAPPKISSRRSKATRKVRTPVRRADDPSWRTRRSRITQSRSGAPGRSATKARTTGSCFSSRAPTTRSASRSATGSKGVCRRAVRADHPRRDRPALPRRRLRGRDRGRGQCRGRDARRDVRAAPRPAEAPRWPERFRRHGNSREDTRELFVFGILGLFESVGLVAPGVGWFLYFFLIPFWSAFPMAIWGAKVGMGILGAHLIGFPILKILLAQTSWGQNMAKNVHVRSGGAVWCGALAGRRAAAGRPAEGAVSPEAGGPSAAAGLREAGSLKTSARRPAPSRGPRSSRPRPRCRPTAGSSRR